jgi:metacaspase-1
MNKALLVGINAYPNCPLNGCLNDIADMAGFLTSKCSFSATDIRSLSDTQATKTSIIDNLQWLVSGAKAGDRLLFHYSGHGVQLPTHNRKIETDGKDEAICPFDFDWSDAHTIRDKEFNQIFAIIPPGIEFVWVSDSCHSGDLEKDMPRPGCTFKTMRPPDNIARALEETSSGVKGKTSGGLIEAAQSLNLALISGCKSGQTSSDADFKGRYNGALTYYLLLRLKHADGLSVPLATIVKDVNTSLKRNEYKQSPQLDGNDTIKGKAFLCV